MARKSPTPLALPEILRIVGADTAYLYLARDGGERLQLKSARDADGADADEDAASVAVLEHVRMSREPVSASGDSEGAAQLDEVPLPPRHILAAPLLLGHRFFGVIYLDRALPRGPFTQDDVDILSAIADHLAIALEAAHTERLELERNSLERRAERLARSKEEALDASRAKSAFIAHMSHELRTPLTAIIGYSELLEEELGEQNVAEPYVGDMQKIQLAAKHLLGLINNMLDLSKIEAGKMELYLEEFELGEVLEEVITQTKPLIEKNANGFTLHVDGALGTVRLDRVKVRQVLLNLMSNAAKFTSGGEVALTALRQPGGPSSGDKGEVLTLQVSDSGIGMSPSQIKRIFQEFAQGSAATTRRYGGTGLGLAISRNFCDLMRGSIEVESALGRGTTFTVRLPARLTDADLAVAVEGVGEGEGDDDGEDLPATSGIYPWPV
jgi:signal transduction histidine kinase